MTASISLKGERVLIVIKHFMLGGLERVVQQHIRILTDAGADVTVWVLENDRDNCLVAEVPSTTAVEFEEAESASLHDLAANAIVMLELGDGSLYPEMRRELVGARRVVRFCHSDYAHLRTTSENKLDRSLSLQEDVIVAVGSQASRFLTEVVGIDPSRVRTLRNAVEPPGAQRPTISAEHRLIQGKYLIAVQSLYRHKGHARMIDALAAANEGHPADERIKVVCVGDGDELLALRRRAVHQGVGDDITWLGGLWQRDLVGRLLTDAHAFLSLSEAEGLPISVLEAIKSEVPLVLSDIDAHRDASRHAVATFVPAHGVAVVAQILREVWDRPRPRYPQSTAQSVREEWTRYCDELITCVVGETDNAASA